MKKVNVVSPGSIQVQKATKVKGGRIKKKDKTKKGIGGPGSTPFHSIHSKIKDTLASGAKEFTLSKKKLADVKSSCSPERKAQSGTPTTGGKKKSAKKVIIPVQNVPSSPSKEKNEAKLKGGSKGKKQSPKERKKSKQLKVVKSETRAPQKINGVQQENSKSPFLIASNVANALKALRKNIEEYQKKQPKIVDGPTALMLSIDFFKLPKPSQIHSRALLPHSVVTDLHEVCFFVRDPKKKKNEADDDESWEEEVGEILKKHDVGNISEIWPWRKFIKLNTQFEEKKKFADRFDFILADSVIAYRWMGVLNKSIFKNKFPIPVRYSPTNPKLKKEFDNALRKIQVKIEGKGLTSSCIFGHDGLSDNQLAENLNALCLFLSNIERYPGGAANIRSLHVKSARSESFPIYISMTSPNQVKIPVKTSKRKSKPVVGELPTLYHNDQVKCYPDGRIYEVKRLRAVREIENNSSPVKKADAVIKSKATNDSDDDDFVDSYSKLNERERNSDVEADSDEGEDKVEEVEREYLKELRDMQEKVKKNPKKRKTTSNSPPYEEIEPPKKKSSPARPKKKKGSSLDSSKTKTPTSPPGKGKISGKNSSAAKQKKSKSVLKGGKK